MKDNDDGDGGWAGGGKGVGAEVAGEYFKRLATEMGMPYQNLINLFPRDCATRKKRPMLEWVSRPRKK